MRMHRKMLSDSQWQAAGGQLRVFLWALQGLIKFLRFGAASLLTACWLSKSPLALGSHGWPESPRASDVRTTSGQLVDN